MPVLKFFWGLFLLCFCLFICFTASSFFLLVLSSPWCKLRLAGNPRGSKAGKADSLSLYFPPRASGRLSQNVGTQHATGKQITFNLKKDLEWQVKEPPVGPLKSWSLVPLKLPFQTTTYTSSRHLPRDTFSWLILIILPIPLDLRRHGTFLSANN